MDPNPKNFPILSYVMSKLPSIGPKHAAGSEFDIEQPPPPQASTEPSFDLTERMPRLTDPKVLASMRSAVAEVSRARSVLKALGDRPDHETVDRAKERLPEVDANLSKQLKEMLLEQRPEEADSFEWRSQLAEKEQQCREAADRERQIWKAVISLDEMHEGYEKMLRDAERKLETIYNEAVSGGDVEDNGGSTETAEEVNEEVAAILREASGKEIDRIDLSGRQLRILPEAFGQIHGLRVLNLSSNQLEAIPDSIGGLESLEELNISSNILDSLPDCIGLLLNLKILDASSNRLVALPDSISRCRSLVELDVSFNKITYLPTNIGYELVNLRRLSIQLNKIRSLPSSVCEMTSLRILDAHFNELRGLPLAIGRLTNLESLNLGSNFADLKELPDTLGDLTNLKELDVSNNQIQALPDTFGRLDSLKKLNLDGNPLVIPPPEFVSRGVEAVKIFMAKRLLDIQLEEEHKSAVEVKEQTQQSGWVTLSTSWWNTVVAAVSGYAGTAKESPVDPYLNQQL